MILNGYVNWENDCNLIDWGVYYFQANWRVIRTDLERSNSVSVALKNSKMQTTSNNHFSNLTCTAWARQTALGQGLQYDCLQEVWCPASQLAMSNVLSWLAFKEISQTLELSSLPETARMDIATGRRLVLFGWWNPMESNRSQANDSCHTMPKASNPPDIGILVARHDTCTIMTYHDTSSQWQDDNWRIIL